MSWYTTSNSGSGVHYYFSDHLGSHAVVENAAGSSCEQDIDYYPYGGVVHDYCGTVTQHYRFTGKERDSESGLDNFGARYYASSLGRFMIPDPAGDSVADASNPQGWNLYAYVLNNPLSYTDPTGLECVWDDGSYDSNDDPVTGLQPDGTHPGCEGNGGVWVDHSFFVNTTNNGQPWADWSPNRNSNLTCGGITPPSGPINYSTQAQSNAQAGALGWYQAFKGGGTQDYKSNSAFGPMGDRIAAGNFNFGASVAAKGWSLTTGQFLAGVGAQLSNASTQMTANARQIGTAQYNADISITGQPLAPVPATPASSTGPGFPGFPVMASNGIMTQGDQAAWNENQAVVSGYLWQSLGCTQ